MLLAMGGWAGTPDIDHPRFHIKVSKQLRDSLLSASPELQSGSTGLSDARLGPARTAYRDLVRIAVQDMVAMQAHNAAALTGHPFCKALMQEPRMWHKLQRCYDRAKLEQQAAAEQAAGTAQRSMEPMAGQPGSSAPQTQPSADSQKSGSHQELSGTTTSQGSLPTAAAAQRSSTPEQSAQSEADDRHAACKSQTAQD